MWKEWKMSCIVTARPHTAKLHTIDPTRSHKYSDSIQTIRILTAVTFSQARSYFRIFQIDQYPIPISSNNQHRSHRALEEHPSYKIFNIGALKTDDKEQNEPSDSCGNGQSGLWLWLSVLEQLSAQKEQSPVTLWRKQRRSEKLGKSRAADNSSSL